MSPTTTTDRLVEELRTGPLAALRPQPVPLDPAWSHDQLGAVLATPPRRPRGRRAVVGVALGAVLVTGTGAAYATGALPGPLDRALRGLVGSHAAGAVVRMHQDVDLHLPGGGRVTTWEGTVDGHPCSATVSNWDGRDRTASYGLACSRGHEREPATADLAFYPDQAQQRWYAVVLGRSRAAHAVSAVVLVDTATGVRRLTAAVDPTTGGYGVALGLGTRSTRSMRVEWGSRAGEVVPQVPTGSPIRGVRVQVVDFTGRVLERHLVMPPA